MDNIIFIYLVMIGVDQTIFPPLQFQRESCSLTWFENSTPRQSTLEKERERERVKDRVRERDKEREREKKR